jgi:hypothetical protein
LIQDSYCPPPVTTPILVLLLIRKRNFADYGSMSVMAIFGIKPWRGIIVVFDFDKVPTREREDLWLALDGALR